MRGAMDSSTRISSMFNRISSKYDLTNRVLSFGIDLYWRRRLTRSILREEGELLDLATGTGDQLIDILKKKPRLIIHGVDVAEEMLGICRKKIDKRNAKVDLYKADAASLPFKEKRFEYVTVSFGIRNMSKYQLVLREIRRVLKSNGQLLILEFSLPKNRFVQPLYLFYLRRMVPLIGGILTRDADAYTYLNRSIEGFVQPEVMARDLLEEGFKSVDFYPLTLGVVTLYVATK